MSNFKVNVNEMDDSMSIIELEGELDVYTIPQLKQCIMRLLETGTKELIVDLTKIEYLDPTTLSVLIGGLKRTREQDGNLVLVFTSSQIRRIFETTCLYKIFGIFNTVKEAIESLTEKRQEAIPAS